MHSSRLNKADATFTRVLSWEWRSSTLDDVLGYNVSKFMNFITGTITYTLLYIYNIHTITYYYYRY